MVPFPRRSIAGPLRRQAGRGLGLVLAFGLLAALVVAGIFVAVTSEGDAPLSVHSDADPEAPATETSSSSHGGRPGAPVSFGTTAERAPEVAFKLPALRAVTGGAPLADGTTVDVWIVVAGPGGRRDSRVVGPLRTTTDASGVAEVRFADAGEVVGWRALSGGTWWRSGLEPTDTPQVEPGFGDRFLVQVLAADGSPVRNVGVAILVSDGASRCEVDRAETGAGGLALIARPGSRVRRDRSADPPPDAVAVVALPILPPTSARIPEEGPGPLVLRLPETGSVRVRVINDNASAAESVGLALIADGAQATTALAGAMARVEDGVALFEHVGLGLRFAATLRAKGDRVTTRVEFAGPVAGRLRVAAELPCGGPRPAVTGRLIGDDGAPRSGVQVQLYASVTSAASPWFPQTQATARSDGDGRFRTTFDVAPEALAGVDVTLQEFVQPYGVRELARRRLGPPDSRGTLDLGDVRAAPVRLVVAGRVTDDAGQPVPSATMMVYATPDTARVPQHELTAVTADDGTFAIHGTPRSPGPYEVRVAYHQRVIAAPVAFDLGASEVQVGARRTGTAIVRVVLPKGLSPTALWPMFEGEPTLAANPDPMGRNRSGGVSVIGGVWQFVRLTAGTGAIVVCAPGDDDRPIARIDDVTITADTQTDAGTLDLSRSVPVATVRVTDASGKPAPDASVWWIAESAKPWARGAPQWQRIEAGGSGTVLVPVLRPLRVLAQRPGSRFAEANAVTTDVTLRTVAARESRITVRLADGIELPDAPFRFEVHLHRLDRDAPSTSLGFTDPRSLGLVPHTFAPGAREFTAVVTEPGRWRAVLMIVLDRGGGGHGATVAHQGENLAYLDDDGAPAEIVVRADPFEIAATCARLERQ